MFTGSGVGDSAAFLYFAFLLLSYVMLDIKFIRENKDLIEMAAKKKRIDFNVSELISLDDERLAVLSVVEGRRAEQRRNGSQITASKDDTKRRLFVEEMRALKGGLQEEEEKLKTIMKKWQALMLTVPNIPDMSVPEGDDESENVEAYVWGEKRQFDFPVKNHMELMRELDMVDFERGAKVHGFRGYFLKGDGAELSWALLNYARSFFGKRNFTPFIAPSILRKEYFYGTGHLPNEADDLFKPQDDDYLSGTAEVPMMAYHSDEILKEGEIPKRYLAFSPCFRREAGSHGKDMKGLI